MSVYNTLLSIFQKLAYIEKLKDTYKNKVPCFPFELS